MNEDTMIGLFLISCLMLATSFGMYSCHEQEKTKREAIKAGLVQKIEFEMRATNIVWAKP